MCYFDWRAHASNGLSVDVRQSAAVAVEQTQPSRLFSTVTVQYIQYVVQRGAKGWELVHDLYCTRYTYIRCVRVPV